jgi:hypothetical protein
MSPAFDILKLNEIVTRVLMSQNVRMWKLPSHPQIPGLVSHLQIFYQVTITSASRVSEKWGLYLTAGGRSMSWENEVEFKVGLGDINDLYANVFISQNYFWGGVSRLEFLSWAKDEITEMMKPFLVWMRETSDGTGGIVSSLGAGQAWWEDVG